MSVFLGAQNYGGNPNNLFENCGLRSGKHDYICPVVKAGFLKAAFNLSAFVLILGSWWFLEKDWWMFVGMIFLFLGSMFGAYSIYTFYMNRKSKFSTRKLLLFAIVSMVALAAAELVFMRWELSIFILLCCIYLFVCYRQMDAAQSTTKASS